MTDNFGAGSKGSGPNSFLSPDKIDQKAKSNIPEIIEDNDEPELDPRNERYAPKLRP